MEKANVGCAADLVSTLPLDLRFFPFSLRKYQGIWIPDQLLAYDINAQHHFRALPTDILITSYPKSGTTWLKALVFATVTRTQHSFDCHPLHRLNPHEIVLPLGMETRNLQVLNEISAMSEPRVLSTHVPFHLLPESAQSTSGCRLVYICREPKDTFLSMYHFLNKMKVENAEMSDRRVALNELLQLCCDSLSPYGTIWDHVLGYWNESLRAPERILFLKYEEMLEAPLENLMRLAEFVGFPFNEEEINRGVHEQIVKLCTFNNLKDLAIQQDRPINIFEKLITHNFYRKGVVGDWKNNNISPEIAERIDQITKNKLLGTGLVLGSSMTL